MNKPLIILSLLITVSCAQNTGVTLPANCIKTKIDTEEGYEYVYKCHKDQ